jgi:hypothetical protein
MKQLLEIIKSSLLLTLILFSFNSFSKTIGRVSEVVGNAFIMTQSGDSINLKVGDKVLDFAEIFTDEGARVSYVDYFEHVVHLGPSTQVVIMNKMIELKNGKMWIQSHNNLAGFSVQTSNAVANYADGEFIYTYDSGQLSSQLLVISGTVKFTNILEDHLFYNVDAGKFSFIDQKYEKGFPRVPTLIGYESYNGLVGTFSGVKPLNKSLKGVLATSSLNKEMGSNKGRVIASVGNLGEKPTKQKITTSDFNKKKSRGHTYFIRAKKVLRLPASADVSPFNYYQSVTKKMSAEKAKNTFKGDTIKIQIYGKAPVKSSSVVKHKTHVFKPQVEIKTELRMPSSVKKIAPVKVNKTKLKIQPKDSFQSSLLKEYAKQKRHTNEVNELIDELESYSDDYKQKY